MFLLIWHVLDLVGNCDGSIDGTRYFDTDPHRGTFAKRHELEAVAE
jgi:dynactin complex subunit